MPPRLPDPSRPAWALSADEALRDFRTSERGLSASAAADRLREIGPNALEDRQRYRFLKILGREMANPLVLTLVGASLISFALGERAETGIILGLVVFSALLGTVQQWRGEQALERLKEHLARKATVIRDGRPQQIDARDLVPGDIVALRLGDIVPADLRLLAVQDLALDESPLTGESEPVPKSTAPVSGLRRNAHELPNMAFAGTAVVQGSGRGIVAATGAKTQAAATAKLLEAAAKPTAFEQGAHAFGKFLLKATVALCAVVFIALGLLRGDWAEAFLFAVALAVGLSPELLPAVVTLTLSRGALKLKDAGILVKRLSAIEDLGHATLFCTDKTGTLTVGQLRVRGAVDPEGHRSDVPLAFARTCLDTDLDGHPKNPIDRAIVEAPAPKGSAGILDGAAVCGTIPFDFTRRRMSCVLSVSSRRLLVVKGAMEETLAACSFVAHGAGAKPMDAARRAELRAFAAGLEDDGHRLVAVARRWIGVQESYEPADEHDLEFVGFVLLADAPKTSAADALLKLQALNVRIAILTGDTERTTRHAARQLGFPIRGILSGAEIDALDDAGLHARIATANVFVRITPAHKLRIVQAFQHAGETVGFLGDGINDAPALHAADVGVSFQEATDVAKDAASLVLTRKNLSALADSIREGRGLFVNTRTYIHATIASNFGNMLSVTAASLLLPFIPLLPIHILILNLLTDVPMLAISTDRVASDDVAKPVKWDLSRLTAFMLYFGGISSVADFITFAYLYFGIRADASLFRSALFLESALTEIAVIFLLRTLRPSWFSAPSRPLALAAVGTGAAFVLIALTRIGAPAELVPLPLGVFGGIVAIVAGYALATEFAKRSYRRFMEATPK